MKINLLPFKITKLVRQMAMTQESWKKQFFPSKKEERVEDFESQDPIGDQLHTKREGLIHRYPDRVLILLTKSCPVYCRFCFRKDVVGTEDGMGTGGGTLRSDQWKEIIDYIQQTKGIREVIFSGGDPFYVAGKKLQEYLKDLLEIEHVKILRFHTRVLSLAPEIVLNTPHLTDALGLASEKKTVYVMMHINHPDELTSVALKAIKKVQSLEIPIISQSVLLKNLNDSEDILLSLFQRLTEVKVIPCYLHQLDHAPGTFHFHVPIHRGRALLRSLQGKIAGYGIPKYIFELPEGRGKVPIHDSFLKKEDENFYYFHSIAEGNEKKEEIKIQKR